MTDTTCNQLENKKVKELLDKSKNLNNFYENITESRKSKTDLCTNKTLLSGNPPSFMATDTILFYKENEKIYCFDYGDVNYLLLYPYNPYTKNPFKQNFIDTLKKIKGKGKIYCESIDRVINEFILEKSCPHEKGVNPYMYYITKKSSSLNIKNALEGEKRFDAAQRETLYIFRITLSKPYMEKGEGPVDYTKYSGDGRNYEYVWDIKPNFIEKIDLIYDPESRESTSIPSRNIIIPPNTKEFEALYNYMQYVGDVSPTLSDSMKEKVAIVEKLNIRLDHSIIVYRGLSTDVGKVSNFLERLNILEKIKIGQEIPIKEKFASSWTTNYCIAEGFAKSDYSIGLVVKLKVDPKDIIIDTRMINLEELQDQNQSEIILKKNTYYPTVVTIIYAGRRDLKIGWNYNI